MSISCNICAIAHQFQCSVFIVVALPSVFSQSEENLLEYLLFCANKNGVIFNYCSTFLLFHVSEKYF